MSAEGAAEPLSVGSGPFALVLDVETLGLPEDYNAPVDRPGAWPPIVEIAWQVVDGFGDVLRERAFLVRPPGLDLDVKIAGEEVHGITASQLDREGVPLDVPLSVLEDDVRVFSPSFVAHNADFDARVVGAACHQSAVYSSSTGDFVADLDRVCTMKAATGRVGDRDGKWPTLDELVEDLFGESREGAHRALVDMRDTARAFQALRERGLIKLAVPERRTTLEIDAVQGEHWVREAVDRYVDDLHALPTYYDPADLEGLGDDRFIRSVVRRVSSSYRPAVAERYWTPYDAVSSRMALALAAEDEVVKYHLALTLETATGVIPSAVRYSGDALGRAITARVERGLPVVTKLDVQQFYASVDYDRLVQAVQDLTELAADAPFLGALRGSLLIPYRADEVKERGRGLTIGVPSEAYLAELFLERVEQDIRQAGVEMVRVNDEFYVFSPDLPTARNDFARVHNALLVWGLTVARSKTRVEHHRPSYGDIAKHIQNDIVLHSSHAFMAESVFQYTFVNGPENKDVCARVLRLEGGMTDENRELTVEHLAADDGEPTRASGPTVKATPTGIGAAVAYVNRLFDSLSGSRLQAAIWAPAMKARIQEWSAYDACHNTSSYEHINRINNWSPKHADEQAKLNEMYVNEGLPFKLSSAEVVGRISSLDGLSQWIDYDIVTPEAIWGLVPVLHEYPRGEFLIARAVDVLVTTAVECVHRTILPSAYRRRYNYYSPDGGPHAHSTALAEAEHLAILALLDSHEIHPHVIYVLVRRMYRLPDSLLFGRDAFRAKQVYARGVVVPGDEVMDIQPVLPFAEQALAALERWRHSQHLPLRQTLKEIL